MHPTSAPERPPQNTEKASRWSVVKVLGAALLIIPGLCFGIAVPGNMGTLSMMLLMFWVGLFILFILVLVVEFIMYVTRKRPGS